VHVLGKETLGARNEGLREEAKMRRKRLTLKIRSSKRFSSNKKLEQPYVSYSLPPIVLLCFCVLYYCLFFTSSPANYEPPHSISITNHSSLVISTELISRSISIPNLSSSLSASPPPPPPPPGIFICAA